MTGARRDELEAEVVRLRAAFATREADLYRVEAIAHTGSRVQDVVAGSLRVSVEARRILGIVPEGDPDRAIARGPQAGR